jgi:hypothetical protein
VAQSAQLPLEDERFQDRIPIYATAAISDDHENGIDQSKDYKARTKSPLTNKWDIVMKEELDAIGQRQVSVNFLELPERRNALPSHWVYKIKCDGAGNVQQFKARLLSGGNHHIEGIDYQAIYALTVRLSHIRLALAIAAKYDLEIHRMGICMSVMGVDFAEEIYMHPPQESFHLLQNVSRYSDPRLTKISLKMVLCFRKSLYGLKHSSHVWYGTFNDFVISIGFKASRVDGELLVLEDQGTVVAAVVQYVDNHLIFTNEGLIGRSRIK